METYNEYKALVEQMFARYGFIGTPLDDSEIKTLWLVDMDLNDVHSIGCDVNAGFDFNVVLLGMEG